MLRAAGPQLIETRGNFYESRYAGIIGVEPSSRITDGVSIKDVATNVATLPEVQANVADPST